MAWTQADIDALKQAIATGATRVRFKDHETTFRSYDEMRRTLRDMEAEVSPQSAAPPITVSVYRDGF